MNIPMIEASPIRTGGLRGSTNVVAAERDVTPEERSEDLELIAKIERLPRDVGWLLIYVGALGFILPGVFGLPFVIAGTAIIAPNREKWLARLIGRNPPKLVHSYLKQISRMVDDLERRYPSLPSTET